MELLLALTLSVLVFAAIAMAIDLHLRVIDAGRTETEEAQLARAVLRRMADDLRGAVQYQAIDFSSLQSLAADAQDAGQNVQSEDDFTGAGLDEGAEDGTGGETGSTDAAAGSLEDDPAAADSTASQDIAATAAPAVVPGVYGNQYELQIDVSRLPRPEEFGGLLALDGGATPMLMPSDVKTVSYYLQPPGTPISAAPLGAGGFADEAGQGGLVRRELDRAVALYAAQVGDPTLVEAGEVIAPEVTWLEFRYFDGTQWYTEWDSELMQGLPMAVEIALGVTPRRFLQSEEDSSAALGGDEPFPGEIVYRMVVRLPAARPPAPASTTEETGL